MKIKIILFAIILGIAMQSGLIVGAQEEQSKNQSWYEWARSYMPAGRLSSIKDAKKVRAKQKQMERNSDYYLQQLISDVNNQIINNDLIYPTFSTKMNALLKANEVSFTKNNSELAQILGSDRVKELQTKAYASAAQNFKKKRDELSEEEKKSVTEKEALIDKAMNNLTAACASSVHFSKKLKCWEENMSPEQRAAAALVLRMERQKSLAGQIFPKRIMRANEFYKPITEQKARAIKKRLDMNEPEWQAYRMMSGKQPEESGPFTSMKEWPSSKESE